MGFASADADDSRLTCYTSIADIDIITARDEFTGQKAQSRIVVAALVARERTFTDCRIAVADLVT